MQETRLYEVGMRVDGSSTTLRVCANTVSEAMDVARKYAENNFFRYSYEVISCVLLFEDIVLHGYVYNIKDD